MKLLIDRKTLLKNLKLLKDLSRETPKAEQERFKDTVLLTASGEGLSLAAGFGQAFMCVTLPAQIESVGEFLATYSLLELVKAAKDDEISLSKNDRLTISGKSRYKAYLNEKIGTGFPVPIVREMIGKGISNTFIFLKEDLLSLISLADVYAPVVGWNYMEIAVEGDTANGTVMGSDVGYVEEFPMQVEGDAEKMFFRMHPDYIKPLLSFCGERVKIQVLNVNAGFLLLTDPDNESWWATLVQVGRNSQEKYESN